MIRLILALLLFVTPVFAYDIGPHTPADVGGTLDTMSVSGAGSGVYGDLDGYQRVLALETALDNLTPGSHPRLYLTTTLISELVTRAQNNTTLWQAVKTRADASTDNIQDNALVALVFANDSTNYPSGWSDTTVQAYVDRVITGINAGTSTAWPDNQYILGDPYREVSVWSIGFDWVYSGLTSGERETIIDKIATYIDYGSAYTHWDNPANEDFFRKETLHRELWMSYSWQQWPEIAVAGHNTTVNPTYGDDALTFAKRRWSYDTSLGDALRWIVYQNDGMPMEGYQHGVVGIGWFIPLATSYNIDQWKPYMEAAAEQTLYELDLSSGANKRIFHYGVSGHIGGIYSIDTDASEPWRQRDYMMRGWSYFNSNEYLQWSLENVAQIGTNSGSVSWLFSQEYYTRWEDFEPVADLIWYDVTKTSTNPSGESYSNLATGKRWGLHRGVSRTGWGDDETIFELRARSATTRTSHSLFDAASFQIYRDGNLSADTGIYDAGIAGWPQAMYREYTSSTIATNSLLLVDPLNPGLPATQVGATDENYGGTEGASMRTFGFDYSIGSVSADKVGTVVAHSSYADESRIVDSSTNELWDWFAADATVAYKNRADEFVRQAVTLKRPNGNMYVVIFDRVEAPTTYEKRFIQHYTDDPFTMPSVVGTTTGSTTEVVNHITNYNADEILRVSTQNPSATYTLHTWNVLPSVKNLRFVGGRGTEANCDTDGYDFYREGVTDANTAMDWWINDPIDSCIGGSTELLEYFGRFSSADPDNLGTWRSELKAQSQTTRDYFLTVMYSAGNADNIPTVALSSDNGVVITDGAWSSTVTFDKTGAVGGDIVATDITSTSFGGTYTPDGGSTPPTTPSGDGAMVVGNGFTDGGTGNFR